jgi:hypothetical protein
LGHAYRIRFLLLSSFVGFCFYIQLITSPTAEAAMLDRIKDIYNAPEQLQAIQEDYQAMKQSFEAKQQQTEEALAQSKLEAKRLADQSKLEAERLAAQQAQWI